MQNTATTHTWIQSISSLVVDWADYVEYTFHVPFFHFILELLLVLWIVRLLTRKSYNPKETRLELTKEEEDKLVVDWEPEPLVPNDVTIPDYVMKPKLVKGKPSYRININDKDCLNLCTMNFLGFVGNEEIEQAAIKTLRKYGVGSCGPRGFYGTIDVHLNLEKKIAEYLRTEEAILYSYGFSTMSSAIPAYSKRTDVIFCDKGVSFAIQKGIVASRSRVYWFEHNDMVDLERKMKEQEEKDKKNPKKAAVTRRFLVIEGLYINTGDIAPLPEIIELANKYKVRVFIDESYSFGVLGKRGCGITDHFGIPFSQIDLIAVSLETSLGSVGGFCAGPSFVIDHQRLSGQGYCFSASLPPLLAVAAETGLELMEKESPSTTSLSMFEKLEHNSRFFRKQLDGITGLVMQGEEFSPILHLYLKDAEDMTREKAEKKLELFVDQCQEKGVGLTAARYLNQLEMSLPPPSIRVSLNTLLKEEDMENSTNIMKEVAKELF